MQKKQHIYGVNANLNWQPTTDKQSKTEAQLDIQWRHKYKRKILCSESMSYYYLNKINNVIILFLLVYFIFVSFMHKVTQENVDGLG